MDLKKIKLFLLDMDGTIYLDNDLFDGTLEFLDYVKKSSGKYVFLTNNSSKSVDKYVEKMSRIGIKTQPDEFITSVNATVLALKEKDYKKIYVFGTESFKQQLEEAGLPVTSEAERGVDCLCIGYDTELTFKKLEDACILLKNDIDFIAANPDWVCPTWYGYVPDCGSVCEMLFRATGKRPRFIGKPQPEMVYLAMKKFGCGREETAVIGDRLYTDIACGVNAGINSIFVLSGEGTMEDLKTSDVQPDAIYKNIKEIYEELKG